MTSSETRDTVLVIDDDPDMRALIVEIGAIAGVRIIEAADCCEGLKVVDKELGRIKLIFLDYFMPGMTPSDCAKALKAKVTAAQIPIILVTAAVAPQERAAELELSRWISKPFEVKNILQILNDGNPQV
jgi:CheY-like chemotaxis protein